MNHYIDYRAPREHGSSLIHPGLSELPPILRENFRIVDGLPGRLKDLRAPGREQMLAAATKYTRTYRDVETPSIGRPLLMAGHQPTLSHPGVWFKNFALDSIARRNEATAVNLVVDSDVSGPSSIRVPTLHADDGPAKLHRTVVAFDQGGGGVPYEQSLIQDRDLFDTFDVRVASELGSIVKDPLVRTLWDYAREAVERCGYAGCALAQARHRLEADVGLSTLEVPQSVICRTPSFAVFAMELLSDLPRFRQCYNSAAEDYRLVHGIRSRAHPVPNLRQIDGWYEAPFWIYGNQSPRRRPLWVKSFDGQMEVCDGEMPRSGGLHRIFPADAERGAEALMALASPTLKLRSRALVTTMYARLILSDLFVHGIGGGKYDQLGDEIGRRFWAIEEVPAFLVTSATVRLPGHERSDEASIQTQIRFLRQRLRDIAFHPEQFRDEVNGLPDRLIEEKKELLGAVPPRGSRAEWHERINAANRSLSAHLDPIRNATESEVLDLQDQLPEAALWSSREHSFCLYPLRYLLDKFETMLQAEPLEHDQN